MELMQTINNRSNIKKLEDVITIECNSKHSDTIRDLQACVEKRFGGSFDSSKKYVICLQGASASGKSTLAHNLIEMLGHYGMKSFLLEIDSYYRTAADVDIRKYDFDNPASIDWKSVHATLEALYTGNPEIPTYKYSFLTRVMEGPHFIPNPGYNVLVIEGIYGFNAVSDMVFNLDELDPNDSSKAISNEYVKSKLPMTFCNVIRIRMSICKEKALKARIERDTKVRGKSQEQALFQFNNHVWPATQRWVDCPVFREDIRVVHGSFNLMGSQLVLAVVTEYFTKQLCTVEKLRISEEIEEICTMECVAECNLASGNFLALSDDL